MKRSSFVACALGAALLWPALAFGGIEKVFVLTNGHRIRGEIASETPSVYVVKTAENGKVIIPRDHVVRIEDAPAPSPSPTPAPSPAASPSPAPSPAPDVAAVTTPTAPVAVKKTPEPARPASKNALASPRELAEAKKALAAVPVAVPGDEDAAAVRGAALESILKTFSFDVLVAVATEPTSAEAGESFEQKVARELIREHADRSRPSLARAVLAIDLSGGAPTQVLGLVEALGDDQARVLELAILAKVRELIDHAIDPTPLTLALEHVGTPAALPKLFDWIVAPGDRLDDVDGLARAAMTIAARGGDPDALLVPLVAGLDPEHLPPYPRLAGALDVLRVSKGGVAHKVARMLDVLEAKRPAAPDQVAAHQRCLKKAYLALAAMANEIARDRLMRSLDSMPHGTQRGLVIDAIGALPRDENTDALVVKLVDDMATPGLEPDELSAFARALANMTGRSYGVDVQGWRNYLAGKTR